MLHRLALALMTLLASPALALDDCPGADMIAQMPAADRADLQARAAAMPYDTGLLWQATRGDTTLTLFGTYHLAHSKTEAHMAALKPLIDSANLVFLESSPADSELMKTQAATDPSLMFIVTGPTLPQLLDEDDWQAVATSMRSRGFPTFMTAKFKPFFTAMMLGFSPCMIRAQNAGVVGIDASIGQHAMAQSIPVMSLEDYRTPLRLFDAFSTEDQIGQLKVAMAMEAQIENVTATLLTAYLAGQTSLFWTYGRDLMLAHGGATASADFEMFEDLILTKRNTAWIVPLLENSAGKRVFVGFGAAHLPGKNGVLSLLQQQGFTITPLPFDP